jgi:hypothetical protein
LLEVRAGFCGKAIALHVTAPRRLECAPTNLKYSNVRFQ